MKAKLLNAFVIVLILFQAVAPVGVLAYAGTDQSDYAPGATVYISGDNSDGAGFAADETVLVDVSGPNGFTDSCTAVADSNSAWSCALVLSADAADGSYSYVATGQTSSFQESGGFTVTAPATPVVDPTQEPTQTPTVEPTSEPTQVVTAEPTVEPTAAPTEEPTTVPTTEPTTEPTAEPTATVVTAPPFIQSDKEDYYMGETVTLTSGNWQPGETIQLSVNDNAVNETWRLSVSVQADNTGAFVYHFSLPNWYVATYLVTATGATSGTATATFTDSPRINNVTVGSQTGTLTYGTGANATYTVTPNRQGNGTVNGALSISAWSPSTPSGLTVSFSPNSGTWTSTGGNAFPSFTLTIGTSTTTPAGTYTFTVRAADGSDVGTGTGTLTVNTKSVTASVTALNKVYDGTTTATINSCTLSGVVSGDTVTCSAGGATFANKNVGTGKTVTATGITLGGTNASNYTLTSTTATTTANITARPITVTAATNSKVYDGTTSAAATPTITVGTLASGDTANFSEVYDNKNVGTNKILTPSGTVTDGNSGGNYLYTFVINTTGVITARPVTVTADAKTKVYGDADPALTYQVTSGTVISGDTFTGALSRAAGENVGSYAIQQGTLSLGSNYALTYAGANLSITAHPITVTADNKSKTYGDADPALTYQVTSGSLAFSDSFSGSLARDPGENVGAYAITQGTLALSTNYSLTFINATLTIGTRAVTVAADAQSKVYGDADPALTYQITSGSLASGDSFSGSLTRVSGENVGTYAINQGTLALNGNYVLTYVGADLSITLRPITVTADPKSKVYGDADPALTYQITSGTLAFTDSFSGALTRAAGENVGSYAIQQGTLALNSNYDLTYVGANLSITQRPITVTADAQTKVYGTADPAFTYQITSGDLVNSDAFTGALTRDPGEDIGDYAITQGSLALSSNYALTYVGANLTITQAELTVTADNKSKTYGQADPLFTFQYSGFQFDDDAGDIDTAPVCSVSGVHDDAGNYTISCSNGVDNNYSFAYVNGTLAVGQALLTITADDQSITYGDADPAFTFQYSGFQYLDDAGDVDAAPTCDVAGPHTDVNTYSIVCSGGLDNNYTFAYEDGQLTVEPALLTVTADDQSREYGDANPLFTFQIDGFQYSDDESTLSTQPLCDTLADAASPVSGSPYAITCDGATADNYVFTYIDGNLTITAAPLTVTPDNKSKTYGDVFTAFTGTITGIKNGDNITASYSSVGSLATASIGGYAISTSLNDPDSKLDNYDVTIDTATLTVGTRAITVTADPQTKVYGEADPTLTYQVTSGDLVNGDTFSGALTREAGEDVGDYAITQGDLALNSNYALSFVGADLTITPRPITVTADAKTKVYGNADPALTYQISDGSLAFDDDFTGALVRAAGEDVGAYAITQGTLALTDNYDLTYVGADLTITVRPITVTADAKTKIYGNVDPALTYEITSGSLAFSDVFTGALARAAGEDVGTYAITQGDLALSSNYALTYVGANFTITERTITVTADAKTKVYGESDPALTYQITTGSLAFSDTFTGALTRDAGENIGSYAITQGTLALSSNYDLNYVGANLTITERPITVTADAQSKVYGNVDPALTYQITSGSLVSGDDFTGALEREPGEDVGTYDILQGTLALDSNYTLIYVGADFTITGRPITVTADDQSKVYGEADPAFTYQITSGSLAFSDGFAGALSRDPGEDVDDYAITQGTLALNSNYDLIFVPGTLTISQRPITVTADDQSKTYGDADPSLTYDITFGSLAFSDAFSGALDRNPGEDVGDYAITQGTLALSSNYVLSFVPGTLSITERPITVTADAKTKVYGNVDPALTYQITSGSLAFSDAFTGVLTRASGENVGSYAIEQGTLALSSNYDLTYVGANLTITERPITVTADAQNKVYGDNDPALTYEITSGSLAFSDTFTGALVRDAGEDVGTYAITQGTLALNSNYDLTYVGANLTITERAITVTADPQTKVYGEIDPALTYQITSGSLVSGDAFTGALERESGEDVGVYDILQGTLALSNNYDLTYVGADFTITERLVTVTADAQTKVYGETDPALSYQITSGSLVSGDDFTGALTRDAGEDVGSYAIQQGTLALSSNYTLTYVGANLTITERPITVTADAQTKVYGDVDPALTYQITSGSLAFSDGFTGLLTRAAGEDVGTYAIIQGTLALNSNYELTFVPGTLSITERFITVTADAKTKVYGNADPALTYQITSGSLAFSDGFTGALTRAGGESVGPYAITQGTLALSSNYALTYVGADLTITERPITVTADNKSKTYGDVDPALTYQITGGSLAFSDAFTGSITRAGGEDVGSYIITQGTLALSSNYDLTFVPGSLTISERPITVTADDKTKTYGDVDPAFTYEITSGTLAFSDSFTGNLSRVAGETVGDYDIIQDTLALSSNYDLSFVNGTLSITKKSASVTPNAASKVYGNADPAFTGTLNGFLPGDGVTATYSRSAGESVAGSPYTLSATLSPAGVLSNYDITYNTANFTITPRSIEVTADAKTKVYGNADPAFTYQITAGSLAFSDAFAGVLTRAAGENVSSYGITQGTLALNGNYDLTFVGANLSITQRPVTVTADAKTKVYGNADPALTYQITSGSLAFSDTFSGALNRAAGENVGTYAINQNTLALNSNYALTYVGANLTITQRPVTVTADAQTKVYGNGDPALTYQITSGSLAFSDAFSGALVRAAGENVGNYAISQGALALSSNYTLSFVGANFNITKATLTVTAQNKSKFFGDPDPIFTFVYSGFKFSDTATVIDTAPSCSVTVAHTAVGTYPITCNGGFDNNYSFSYVNGILTVGSWNATGFYQPVDMSGVVNTVRAGQTVPLKFDLFSGTTELTSTSAVLPLTYIEVSCSTLSTSTTDEIETVATGGTSLRYDTTAGQFIYNWKTPSTANKCYRVTMTAQDTVTKLIAYFKTR